MTTKLRIIVSGLIAQYPLGGVAWDYCNYLVGLHRIGHDVYYIEDSGQWPYNPSENGTSRSCEFNVQYLSKLLSRFGLGDKWGYRFPHQAEWFGLTSAERETIIDSADLLINVSGVLRNPWEYKRGAKLIFIDTDPVFNQIKLLKGQSEFKKMVDTHDVHFSFGEVLPRHYFDTGHDWKTTRHPILTSEWQVEPPIENVFTTVMNWTSYKDVEYEGESYGQKDVEFDTFLDLPDAVSPTNLKIAMSGGKTRHPPMELLKYKNWRIVDPAVVCPDFDSYRSYIQSSKGEWSVAKNGYVKARSGWFSGRSGCYLAAGRPVILQDTGYSEVLPTGEGLIAFNTFGEAVAGIQEVEANYKKHSMAAREIAEEYFDSDKVLTKLIEESFSTD
jgi:hypothetical protein